MTKTVAFHSFRRGTGRTSLLVSLAVILAKQGKRVGIIDTNMQSPSTHILFNMRDKDIKYTLDSFLWGECSLEQTIHDVSAEVGLEKNCIFLIPSSDNAVRIMRALKEEIDIGKLTEAFARFAETYKLDFLLLDSSSGITQNTLFSMSVADVFAIVMRLDEQDYQGVSMTLDLARRFDPAKSLVIVNQVATSYDLGEIESQIKNTFQCEVGAVFPHTVEMLNLASEHIFALKFPEHPLTHMYIDLAAKL